jgi:hypothetical protein
VKACLPLQCRTGLRQLISPLLIGALMAGILSGCQTLGQGPATNTEKTETTAETKATTDEPSTTSPPSRCALPGFLTRLEQFGWRSCCP